MTNTGSVLVVDDNQINREVVALKLVQSGFVATLAASGEEAMGCLELADFDVVVSDVCMPGMSGTELLRMIRIRFPFLPVILMTGWIEEDIRQEAVKWGAAAVFQKPVSREELITAINVAIEDSMLRAGFVAEDESVSKEEVGGIALASLGAGHALRAMTGI